MRATFADFTYQLMSRTYGRGRWLVLAYHGVRPDGVADAAVNLQGKHVAASAFRQQMLFLKARGYRVVDAAMLRWMLEHRRFPPSPLVAITFDDGYRNNYTDALPILQDLSLPAFFHVVSGCIERSDYQWTDRLEQAILRTRESEFVAPLGGTPRRFDLQGRERRIGAEAEIREILKRLGPSQRATFLDDLCRRLGYLDSMMPALYTSLSWAEINEIRNAGHVVGPHTLTHTILTSLSDAEAEYEIAESKRLLDRNLGIECETFSYPNGRVGDFSEASKSALRRHGIRCAFASVEGLQHQRFDPYAIRRIAVNDFMSLSDFKLRITGALGLAKAARRVAISLLRRRRRTAVVTSRYEAATTADAKSYAARSTHR